MANRPRLQNYFSEDRGWKLLLHASCSKFFARVANHGSGQGRVNEPWKLGAVVYRLLPFRSPVSWLHRLEWDSVPGSLVSPPSQVALLDNGIYTQGWRKDLGCGYDSAEPTGLESRAMKISGLILASSSHALLFHFVCRSGSGALV